MAQLEIRQLVSEYLALLRNGNPSPEENEASLRRLLDSLALAEHDVAFEFDGADHPDPPDWPHAERWALAAERFPAYGYYNIAVPIAEQVGEAETAIGDAIDDIADIAGDLAQVAWRLDNTSEADALWHFQHSYRRHWSEHLRHLQLYLESLGTDR